METAPRLKGQTVVVLGGSAGIGLETARQVRAEGADVVLVGRDPGHLRQAAAEVGAAGTAAFDAADPDRLTEFFGGLTGPVDHVMVTAGGNYYAKLADLDLAQARKLVDERVIQPADVAALAVHLMANTALTGVTYDVDGGQQLL
jgi:NADP-dependent 3-hydroxy acid dehydrogenase YdfG